MAFPAAELVDGELAMRAARRIKTPEEVAAIRAALRVAEADWPPRWPNCGRAGPSGH